MEMTHQQVQDMLSTAEIVSKYFIFDEALENIALKEYSDYQEMVDDFRDYSAFVQYGSYYNTIVSWIRDDGVGMEEAAVQALRESMNRASQDGAHIGVGNVHRRIRLRYGQEYGVEISSAKNVRTLVMLWLPG